MANPRRHCRFRMGDILKRPVTGCPALLHFGVYISDSEVIHAQLETGTATAVSLCIFEQTSRASLSEIHFVTDAVRDTVVKRARQTVMRWKYDTTRANCEAHVRWCLDGSYTVGVQVGLPAVSAILTGVPIPEEWTKPLPQQDLQTKVFIDRLLDDESLVDSVLEAERKKRG